MGNSKSKKASKNASTSSISSAIVEKPLEKYTQNIDKIYDNIITAFIDRKSTPDCVYMQRKGQIHIVTRISKSDDAETQSMELNELVTRLEGYFADADMTYEIYYKSPDDIDGQAKEQTQTAFDELEKNTIKLFAHIKPNSLD